MDPRPLAARRISRCIVAVAVIAATLLGPQSSSAQLAKLFKAGAAAHEAQLAREAAEAAMAGSRGARIAVPVAKVPRLIGWGEALAAAAKERRAGTVPITAAWRATRGISTSEAASTTFAAFGTAGITNLYLGTQDARRVVISRAVNGVVAERIAGSSAEMVEQFLRESIRRHGPVAPVKLFVEPDALRDGGLSGISLPANSSLYVATADGEPSLIIAVARQRGVEHMISVRRGLVLRIEDYEQLAILRSLLAAEFDRNEMRVAIAFDPLADEPTVTAFERAIKGQVPLKVIQDEAGLIAALDEARGKTLAMVGHVETTSGGTPMFVVRNKRSEVAFAAPLERLEQLAGERQVTLIPLGCETALHGALVGFARNVWSDDVARQLGEALTGSTWGDFLSALGTGDDPLVIAHSTVNGVQTIVARQARADRNGFVKRLSIPERALRRVSQANSVPTLRQGQFVSFLPSWWSWLVGAGATIAGLGIIVGVLVGSQSIAGSALAIGIFVALLPIAGPGMILYLVFGDHTKPAEGGDQVPSGGVNP